MEVNFPFLLCFTLYLRAKFHVQAPGALIFGGAVFRVTGFGGLYWQGFIQEGSYFRNFTVSNQMLHRVEGIFPLQVKDSPEAC